MVVAGFPSPLEHPLPEVFTPEGRPGPALACDPDGPLVAEVVKTTSDPYVGRLSLVRVFSGTVRPDSTVHVSGHFTSFFGADTTHEDHDEDERVGALSAPLGKQQRPAALAVAGDLCAIGRLSRAETGDTLSDKDTPLVLRPWSMPEPLLPVAVEAHAKADEDKLSQGLQRLAAEDPTLRVEHNAETHQIVLWCMGEAHADVLLDRLGSRFGATVDQVPLRVPLRETFAGLAKGHGRHVKQSGGHGQYAVCDIEVEPLPEGSGLEFVDKVVGGAVPRQFIPSVEKGVRAQMERGVSRGYPVVDIKVTLTDGKSHSVDSSDMSFQTAGALALREAAAATKVALLEPVDEVAVLVPDDLVGSVMSDLSGRRGRVLGSEPAGDERTLVRAEVPQVEIVRYAMDLRSFSHGAATFTRRFARYEPMPDNVAAKLRRVEPRSRPPDGRVSAGRRGGARGRSVSAGAPRSAGPARRTPAAPSARRARGRWRRRPAPGPRAPRCCRCSTSRGRARRGPSRAGRTRRWRPRCRRCRRAAPRRGRCAGSAAASTRRAWSRAECLPIRSASPCRAQPSPPSKPGRLRKMQAPSWTAVLRSPSSSVSIQAFLRPRVVELPVLPVEHLHERPDALLVVLVGEVRAERAAAVVGPLGVDALAALAEDAHPARREPGQVAAEHLVVVGGVAELHPGAGKDKIYFWHAGNSTCVGRVASSP